MSYPFVGQLITLEAECGIWFLRDNKQHGAAGAGLRAFH